MIDRVRRWLKSLRRQVRALSFALNEPALPWPSLAIIVLLLAYVLSPIDLIPDFIPLIGFLDELLLLPIGIWLAVRLMPDGLWATCLERAATDEPMLQVGRLWVVLMVIVIVLVWIGVATWLGAWLARAWVGA